jgi:hypothetical protein
METFKGLLGLKTIKPLPLPTAPGSDAESIAKANKAVESERKVLSGGRDANILFGSTGGVENITKKKLYGE